MKRWRVCIRKSLHGEVLSEVEIYVPTTERQYIIACLRDPLIVYEVHPDEIPKTVHWDELVVRRGDNRMVAHRRSDGMTTTAWVMA